MSIYKTWASSQSSMFRARSLGWAVHKCAKGVLQAFVDAADECVPLDTLQGAACKVLSGGYRGRGGNESPVVPQPA